MPELLGGVVVLIIFVVLISLRQVNQYERGVKFQIGKFKKIVQPCWRLVSPVFQSMIKNDLSSDQSNTVIFVLPLRSVAGF